MANEKKPSIYVDRGTIGSSDELDEYGVWVKSEPQDLSTASLETKEAPDLSSDLSSEISGETSGTDDLDLAFPEIDDLPDFDSLQSEISGGTSKKTFLKNDIDEPEIKTEEKSSGEAFDFEDTLDHEEAVELADDSIELMELEDPAGDMEIPEITEPEVQEAEDAGNGGFTEVSMDDFIGTLDAEPEEIDEKVSVDEIPTDQMVSESSAPDLSTQLLMKIAEELSSIRTELSSLKKEFSGIKAAAMQEDTEEKGFFGEEDDEKIALTGDELNNILNTADFTEEAGADATVELSEDLNIEEAGDDVSSAPFLEEPSPEEPEIINEEQITAEPDFEEISAGDETGPDMLNDLDLDISLDDSELEELDGESDLEDLSGIDLPESELTELNSGDLNSVELDQSSDESEDFLVSMDEEDFSEGIQSGEAATDFLNPGSLDTGSSDTESADILSSDIESDEEALPEFTDEETDELRQIRENGAEPMTFPPDAEDTDYLENDPLAGEPLVENDLPPEEFPAEVSPETIDLSKAVIDEPDLSSEIQDNPPEEPSLEDISIDLDLEDTFDLGTEEDESSDDTAEEEEIPLSLETESTEEGGDLSLIPEGFVVDAEESLSDDSQSAEDSEEETISIDDLDTPLLETEEIQVPDTGLQGEEESSDGIPSSLKKELKTVLSYMDQLLESLPDDKIEEFARSEYYDTYKKLFKELGLV